MPARGQISIFNRSYYEDVLVVCVHNLVPGSVWRQRYNQINEFEELLAENGITILKFFLRIPKDEQRERLQTRLGDHQALEVQRGEPEGAGAAGRRY